MKDQDKISISISKGALIISALSLIISALSFYNSARKYDDATIFINRPQIKIENVEYKKDEAASWLSNDNDKAPEVDLSIKVTAGLINNGTRAFAINDVSFFILDILVDMKKKLHL